MTKVDKYMHVTADIYLENTYEKNNKIKIAREIFRLKLIKDLSIPIDYNFSIKKIQCKVCSGSFDATIQKTCPYCGNEYTKTEDDWIVTSIEKIK